MTKIIWKQIGIDCRKNIKSIFISLLGMILLSVLSYNVIRVSIPYDMPLSPSLKIMLTNRFDFVWKELHAQNPMVIRMALCMLNLNFFLIIPGVMAKLPVRLLRALYICPVDKVYKYRYLKKYLWCKTILCMVVFYLLLATLGIHYPFAAGHDLACLYLGIMLFAFLNLNLKADPGNRTKAPKSMEDEKSGQTLSNVYWFAMLIVELVLFAWMYLEEVSWNPLLIVCWVVLFIINICFAKYCVRSVLTDMMAYEKIYFPVEEEET